MTQFAKKSFQSADVFPHDILVEGVFIASQIEHRKWIKDGVEREMDVLCLFVQSDKGVFVCRSFNPPYRFDDFKAGDKIVIPVSEYRVENGVKSVMFRLN